MEGTSRCPECGARLTGEALSDGLCAGCLLRLGLPFIGSQTAPKLSESALAEEIPPQIGAYRILGCLGRGGMGEVYLAEEALLQRQVALKVLREDLQVDDTARRRFLREARSAAALEHPYNL